MPKILSLIFQLVTTISIFKCLLKVWIRANKFTLVAFVLIFSAVYLQMCLQIARIRRCIVTLITFVWLFSIVRFQMCFKSACTRGVKVTSVAFVCLFPNVHFQMSPQMACLTFESCTSEESLLQLVLLLWPKIDRGCSHIGFICLTFVNCAF